MTSDLTPVKVRGKRCYSGKTKLTPRAQRSSKRVHDDETDVSRDQRRTPSAKRPRNAKQVPLSQLEQLPTEVVELIFLASGNVDLPFVSRTLCLRLSSSHLRVPMIDNILKVLLMKNDELNDADIYDMQRLLDRRCFTWSILQQWLDRNIIERLQPQHHRAFTLEIEHNYQKLSRNALWAEQRPFETCYADRLNFICGDVLQRLRIPARAFRSPWTDERISSLIFWFQALRCCKNIKRVQADQAHDGVIAAIRLQFQKSANLAARCFITFYGVLDQHVFESAVMEGGFDKGIIGTMLQLFGYDQRLRREGDVDRPSLPLNPLSPTLWQWADLPEQIESGSGAYLKRLLTNYIQAAEQSYDKSR